MLQLSGDWLNVSESVRLHVESRHPGSCWKKRCRQLAVHMKLKGSNVSAIRCPDHGLTTYLGSK